MTTLTDSPAADAERRPIPTSTDRFAIGLVAIALVGAAVRAMNVLWWRPTTDRVGYLGYKLGGDAFYYHWQANALGQGHWFVDPFLFLTRGQLRPSAAHPPLYTLYLGVWSRLGVESVTGHRLVSGLLGVGAVVLIGILAKQLAGNLAGLVAAGISAVYPQLWISDGMLLSESLAVFTTACALIATYAYWRSPRLRTGFLMGFACGIAALSRTELALLFPFVVLPLVVFTRSETARQRVKLVAVAFAAGALVIVPWVTFNLLRFDEPTFMTSSFGGVLSSASCDGVYYGEFIGYYANCYTGPRGSLEQDESVRDTYPGDYARAYIGDHLDRLPVVVAARIGRLWGVFDPGQTTWLDWWLEGRGRTPSYLGLAAYYLLVPFAIVGLVVLRKRRVPILPLVMVAVIATLAAAITFGVTRYRAPAEVVVVSSAAVGAVAALRRFHDRGSARAQENTIPATTLAEP